VILSAQSARASAENRLTLKCEGIKKEWNSGVPTEKHVTIFYTLYIFTTPKEIEDHALETGHRTPGRWYEWEFGIWWELAGMNDTYYFLDETLLPVKTGTLWINRTDGTWYDAMNWTGGGTRYATTGTCEKVPLRVPPGPKF
jgi:hypothetical protein